MIKFNPDLCMRKAQDEFVKTNLELGKEITEEKEHRRLMGRNKRTLVEDILRIKEGRDRAELHNIELVKKAVEAKRLMLHYQGQVKMLFVFQAALSLIVIGLLLGGFDD